MSDRKIQSNGNLDYWWIPLNGLANPEAPTETEIAAGLRLTPATAWDGTTFPNATDSNDVDDRSLEDAGNAVERGYEQMEATATFFYPRPENLGDPNDPLKIAFDAFRTPRVTGFLVTRVLQRVTAPGVTPTRSSRTRSRLTPRARTRTSTLSSSLRRARSTSTRLSPVRLRFRWS